MFAYFPLADVGFFPADVGSLFGVNGRRADAEDPGLDALGPGLWRADVEGLGVGAGVWRARKGLVVVGAALLDGVNGTDALSKAFCALNQIISIQRLRRSDVRPTIQRVAYFPSIQPLRLQMQQLLQLMRVYPYMPAEGWRQRCSH